MIISMDVSHCQDIESQRRALGKLKTDWEEKLTELGIRDDYLIIAKPDHMTVQVIE
jgi:hypothetical protein